MHRTTYHGRREQTAAEAPKNLFARIVKEVYPFGILFLIIFILLRFIFMLNFVPTASMTPTIPKKSLLISTRYDVGNIDRYDIVIFRSPAEEGTLLLSLIHI